MLHLRLTNRMESVFRVSSIVSLTAWLCVGVQQPAVCMRASGRQQECVSPVMNGAEDAEACGRAASRGSPAPRGSPASGQIQTPTRGFPVLPPGLLGFSRGRRVLPKASGSPGVQRAELDGSLRGAAGYICLPYSAGATAVLSLPPSASLSLCLYLHNLSADTPPGRRLRLLSLISDQPDRGDDKLTPACLPPTPSLFRRLPSQISHHAVLQTRSGVTFECPLCNP